MTTTTKVELLRRTPHGAPGDVVEVDEDTLKGYGPEYMKVTKKPLTSQVVEDPTAPAPTVDAEKNAELTAKETALADKEAELAKKETDLTAKEGDLEAREKAVADKEAELAKTPVVQTGAVTDAKNTAVKSPK